MNPLAMAQPLLYTYRRCPYAMRARMALRIAGVAYQAHEIVLRDKPAALLAVSPKGTVPVLVLPDGWVLEQSWHIVEWALTHDGAHSDALVWWQRAQTPNNVELLQLNDGPFKHHLDRYKYPDRYPNDGGIVNATERRVFHRDRAVHVLLDAIEHRLAGDPFLGGDQPCAVDVGIFPFVRQFAAVDPAWFQALPHERTRAWLDGWLQSALFLACMQKPGGVEVNGAEGISG